MSRSPLNGWAFVWFKAKIDFVRFLMGIGYERAIEYLSRYLTIAPHAEDRRDVLSQLEYLKAWLAQN